MICECVTLTELMNLINALDANKNCEPDSISPQLVKDNCIILARPLLYLYNVWLAEV